MTNSEMENESKASDGVKETPNQVFSIKSHISKLANKALAEEKKDFNFKSDTTDLDELADEIFDALYDHTNK
tara:strand:+ start:1718 stop:1933 length:216 start_codon:yes stop_codon:yes gene_type:complete